MDKIMGFYPYIHRIYGYIHRKGNHVQLSPPKNGLCNSLGANRTEIMILKWIKSIVL